MRLAALVLATVLPLLGFGLADVYHRYRSDQARAAERALELATGVGAVVSADIASRIQVLRALALSPALRAGDIAAFRAEAEAFAATVLPGTNILLLEADGQHVMNLGVPRDAPLPVRRNTENMRRMFATGEPAVSDVYFGIVLDRPVVGIDVPVRNAAGQIVYSLSVNPELHMFGDTTHTPMLPAGWLAGITDRQGVIVARNREPELHVGRHAAPELLARIRAGEKSGVLETLSRDGIPVLTAFVRTEPLGWTVAVAMPRAELLAPVAREATLTVGAAAGVLLLGLFLAFAVSRGITRPIALLQRIASAAAPMQRIDTGLPETDGVARALVAAHEARERHEAALRDLNQALEQRVAAAIAAHDSAQVQLAWAQKMEAVGQLTGGVAHDFNNLLTAIGGSLALLEPALPDAHLREIAAGAQRAVDRGARLTASLLAFSRKQRLDPQPVDANALLTEFEPLIRRAAGENVAVSFAVDGALRPCNADPAQLEAAILNLVINARDAMAPTGGALTIATRNVTLTRRDLADNPEAAAGAFVAIVVEDTGHGMSADVLSKAFEPFFTTKEVGKGSGLGLSQAYGFARQLGGHVAIDSQPDQGTRVTLYLPALAAAPATVATARPSTATRQLAGTVLVAEDDPDVREIARATLQAAGCRILLAGDGPEALAILRTEPEIDLLFSDVVMPNGMSGTELARTARQMRPGLKVLLTSGFIGAALERHAADGEFPVLAKPYRRADLMAQLSAALGGTESRAETRP